MKLGDTPSVATHRYYRAVVVPALRDHCGYESDADAHNAIKAAFFRKDPRGELPSMGDMSQEEACRLIDYAIRESAEMGLVLPDPRSAK